MCSTLIRNVRPLLALLLLSLIPSEAQDCFQNNTELFNAVTEYMVDPSENTTVANKYGWPINEWCVGAVTDFTEIFSCLAEGRPAIFPNVEPSTNHSSNGVSPFSSSRKLLET